MKVLKFGGTSVGSAERMQRVIEIATKEKAQAVVVSAMGGTTDQLIEMAAMASQGNSEYVQELQSVKERHTETCNQLEISNEQIDSMFDELSGLLHGIYLIRELSKRSLDRIMSFGERLSATMVSQKMDSQFLDARNFVKTNSNFGSAHVDFQATFANIRQHFQKTDKVQVVTGFIGSNEEGETTTLGRGGSDYSASIFGAALQAEEVQIWTDVDGVMTADPRKVKKAFPLQKISYEEAMEMAHFGAKVIHPPTMRPAMEQGIPIRIKNTMNPDSPGTLISETTSDPFHHFPIKGISSISDVALLTVQGTGLIGIAGIAKRLFDSLAKQRISVILITQASSEHSITFAIKPECIHTAVKTIEEEFAFEIRAGEVDQVIVDTDLSIIAVVGGAMKNSIGLAGQVFSSLGRNGVNIHAIAQGSSELNISMVIKKSQESKALQAIHENFFLSETKTINIFLMGTGLIGSTLLKQIATQSHQLEKAQLDFQLVGIANSKKMLINEDGINISDWQNEMENGTDSNLDEFIEKMSNLDLSNSIFVDCTSSQDIANAYEKILKDSISIVTANKKANSSSHKNYIKLQKLANKYNTNFLYETNVGAGLPIINTLQNIILSGDEVTKIEAVLSGTLSYIFNNFNGEKSFSEVVQEAQAKGYTEPDPREDLNGLDVARKILILARESGFKLELKDIEVENLVPENCRDSASIQDFFQDLSANDQHFSELLSNAQSENKKLCYIAKLEDRKAQVKLAQISSEHPFYNLSGSDNIISFHTKHYNQRPLVVQGPGAGADVTASGVFADMIKAGKITPTRNWSQKHSILQTYKNQRLVISLIGMSNVGKSFWSKKLSEIDFEYINCDDLIEKKLTPMLQQHGYKGLADLAKWLGQPYEDGFAERQKQYLACEVAVMEEILEQIKNRPEKNIVIDTTGSIVHTGDRICQELKSITTIIHLKADKELQEEMFETFLNCPKPLIWKEYFSQKDGESSQESLSRSYRGLLAHRDKLYSQYADIEVPYSILDPQMSAHEFLESLV